MKTSWLNGSKRILSALLIAAALMFGWTPLGEGKALAATDKGKKFADAAMLFAKTGDTAFGEELYSGTNLFLSGGAWCVAFVAVVAKQCNIPESVIPNPNLKMTADLYAPATSSFHPVLPADKYVGSYAQYKSLYEANPNYTPQVGDIIVLNSYKDAAGKTYFSHWQHVGIVTAYNPTSKVVTFVSGNWGSVVKVSNYKTTKTTIEYWEDDETGCTVWSGILGYYHIDWSKVTSMREPNAVTGITLKDGNTELPDGALVTLAPGDTRQITSTVSTKIPSAKAFYPDPDKGVYRQQGKMTLNTSYTGLYWKSSAPSIVKVDRNTGLLTAVKNGTATITVYAIADGKRTRATAVKTSFDVYVDSNLPVTREWYPYETQKNIELRTTPTYSSNNLYGTIFAGTKLQIDLLHVTKAVVNSKTYWYAPVQVNDDEVVYCDISDQSVIRPMRAPSEND